VESLHGAVHRRTIAHRNKKVGVAINYQETYSRMGDDELLRLASEWGALTESAQRAVTAELDRRNLKAEIKAAVQASAERLPAKLPSNAERVMFCLFIVGLPSAFLLPRVLPESMQGGAIYDLIHGVSLCWMLWLIVWLVIRARRIQRTK
jgi:hypothetical protein